MGRRGRPGERRTERAGAKRQTFHGYGEQSAPTGRRINRRSVRRAFIARSCISCISCISCWSSWGVLMARRRRAGGCRENFSLPGCGAAPHSLQSANSQSSYRRALARQKSALICEICVFYTGSPAGGSRPLIGSNRRNRRFPCQSSCAFVVLRALRVSPAGQTFHILPAHLTRRPAGALLFSVLCSLFSVLCSLFSVLRSPLF